MRGCRSVAGTGAFGEATTIAAPFTVSAVHLAASKSFPTTIVDYLKENKKIWDYNDVRSTGKGTHEFFSENQIFLMNKNTEML